MTAEPIQRGRGRPRKDGQPNKSSSKPKNPDCEPASKGYVKCIARKFYENQILTGIQFRNQAKLLDVFFWGFLTLIFGILFWIYNLTNTYLATFSIVAAAFVINALSEWTHGMDEERYSERDEHTEFMQKYIPPEEIKRVCETFNKPKKECEED
jgi:hypothetical protein